MHFVRVDAQSYGILILDCAPDSKQYTMKCEFVVSMFVDGGFHNSMQIPVTKTQLKERFISILISTEACLRSLQLSLSCLTLSDIICTDRLYMIQLSLNAHH